MKKKINIYSSLSVVLNIKLSMRAQTVICSVYVCCWLPDKGKIYLIILVLMCGSGSTLTELK